MNEFERKCYDIFDKNIDNAIDAKDWDRLTELFNGELDGEYKFVLDNFGGVYVKEGMGFKAIQKTPLATKDGMETFSFFSGVYGNDNIFKIQKLYLGQIPPNLLPIGCIDGGNLLCMDKYNKFIYIWIHDQVGNNVYLASKNLHDFVMSFQMGGNNADKNDLGVVGVKCSQDFLKALRGLKNN